MNLSDFCRRSWVTPGLLVFLTLLAYANTFPGTFVLDDIHIVQHNGLVHHPDLITIFTSDYWHGFENSGLFRPVTILSLAINRMLLGDAVWAFHLGNVLLHAGVVVLLWSLLRAWGLPAFAAGAAAALFAVHPLHTEAINIVVGRSELLVAVFLLAGFLLALRDGKAALFGVCGCYLLALCSKEHAIAFLALLPLAETFRGGLAIWRRRWPLYAALLLVALTWLLWRYYFVILHNPLPRFPVTEAAAPIAFVDTTTRVLSSLLYQGLYLGKMFLPYGLQSVYSINDLPPFVREVFSVTGLLVIAGSGLVLTLLALGWRRGNLVALCGILYLVAFLPTSNLFFPIGATVAERLAYFPSVWFCAGIGAALAGIASLPKSRGWTACLVVYLMVLSGVLLLRNRDYASELALWSAEVEENPSDFLGWQSLAESYNNLERYADADRAYLTMLSLAPDYPGGLRSRTNFFMNRAMYALALPTAAKAFAISARENEPISMAFDGLDMAEVAMGMGNCTEALEYLDGPSLPLRDNLRALEVRAATLACLGRHAEALEFFARIAGEPKEHRILYHYGLSLFQVGRLAEARAKLEEQVRQDERDFAAWNLLGVVSAEMGDWASAVTALGKAAELAPQNERYRENLERARAKLLQTNN